MPPAESSVKGTARQSACVAEQERNLMYKASAEAVLPTTIIGSLPRPSWYTENLSSRPFREAMVNRNYREQYLDAASAFLRDQEVAGLDILTDGDCRFDA